MSALMTTLHAAPDCIQNNPHCHTAKPITRTLHVFHACHSRRCDHKRALFHERSTVRAESVLCHKEYDQIGLSQ
jgi:hypothetical protein